MFFFRIMDTPLVSSVLEKLFDEFGVSIIRKKNI